MLRDIFPGETSEETIRWLVTRYSSALGETAYSSDTELWIKLDRLEEAISFLALSNVEIADQYRRLAVMEIPILHRQFAEIAGLVVKKSEDAN